MRRFIPSLSSLECFEAAARFQSFTRAAEDLGITQSGVSRQISSLEGFLGLNLFQRIGSRLVLTQAGEGYLRETHRLLTELESSAIDTVRGQRLAEAFVIEAPIGFATRWLIPRLARMMQTHEQVLIELRMQDNRIAPNESHADLILRHGSGTWSDVRAEPLGPEQLTVIAPPDFPGLEAPLTSLDFETLPTLQNATRPDLWMTWLRSTGVPHRGAIRGPRFDNNEALIAAAHNGLGLALVPRLYVLNELKSGALQEPFPGLYHNSECFWALRSERLLPHPIAPQIVTWLKAEMKTKPDKTS